MPRLEIELTSRRDDGTWTWRAAGARQPRGTVSDELVPDGATTGAVVRADTEVDIDGITVVGISPISSPEPAAAETIEIIGSGRDDPGVVTSFAPKPERGKGRGPGGRREPRRPGGDQRGRGGGRDRSRPAGEGRSRPPGPERDDRGSAEGGRRRARSRPGGRDRKERAAPPPVPKRPKPKRLRPGRAHRDALIQSLPAEHQPIAEKLASGGMPAVRKAIAAQNSAARAEGRPEVPSAPLVAVAEALHPKLRAAEWRDRAEAARDDLDALSLQDLRSVVSAAGESARDPDAQALAATLREGLARRVEEARGQWVDDVRWSLDAGRLVRALRLSSRPPDRKQSLPDEVLEGLKVASSQALNSETGPERWALILEAVSFSPVRREVVPAGPPSSPSPELLEAVAQAAQRTPQIASLFGIDVKAPPGTPARTPSPPPPPAVPKPPEAAPPAEKAPAPAPPAETAPAPAPPAETASAPAPPAETAPAPAAAPAQQPGAPEEAEAPHRPPPAQDTPAEKVAEAALRPDGREDDGASERGGS